MTAAATAKPLAGVRVLDFSRLLPGAYCTWLLAALGADVIKLEQPGKGDYQREIGVQAGTRGSALFQLVNQGKRSIGIDLKSPAAAGVVAGLVAGADVLVESFRPGVARRLGIDFEALKTKRPALICVSINGFGANSPLRLQAAHDINYLALSGLMSRQLRAGEGVPDIPLVDLVGGGLFPALSTLALLNRARLTGVGGVVDASLADAMCLLPYEALATVLLGLPEPNKAESEFAGRAANYGVYDLQDGYVAVGAVEDGFWSEFCRRMGLEPGACKDGLQNPGLKADIARRFRAMSRTEVRDLFAGADACVTVVQSYAEMLTSEHATARQFVASAPEPGAMPRLASPFFHDGRREFVEGATPLLGEHTAQILADIGYAPSQIEALTAESVVVVGTRPRSNERSSSQ
jgi:crotonobetainyl-CoA:carnitine CoA-transferase CaiB-like acyl-CoA transferase